MQIRTRIQLCDLIRFRFWFSTTYCQDFIYSIIYLHSMTLRVSSNWIHEMFSCKIKMCRDTVGGNYSTLVAPNVPFCMKTNPSGLFSVCFLCLGTCVCACAHVCVPPQCQQVLLSCSLTADGVIYGNIKLS